MAQMTEVRQSQNRSIGVSRSSSSIFYCLHECSGRIGRRSDFEAALELEYHIPLTGQRSRLQIFLQQVPFRILGHGCDLNP